MEIPITDGEIAKEPSNVIFEVYRGVLRFKPFLDGRFLSLSCDEIVYRRSPDRRQVRLVKFPDTPIERRILLSRSTSSRLDKIQKSLRGAVSLVAFDRLAQTILEARRNILKRF
jgi:hypothetical protein